MLHFFVRMRTWGAFFQLCWKKGFLLDSETSIIPKPWISDDEIHSETWSCIKAENSIVAFLHCKLHLLFGHSSSHLLFFFLKDSFINLQEKHLKFTFCPFIMMHKPNLNKHFCIKICSTGVSYSKTMKRMQSCIYNVRELTSLLVHSSHYDVINSPVLPDSAPQPCHL